MNYLKKGLYWLIISLIYSGLLSAEQPSSSLFELAHQKMKPNVYTNIDSMLVYKNNQIISQHYYGRFNNKSTHRTHSTFKSINALIALIAIDQGLLKTDELVIPLLEQFAKPKSLDPRRDRITVQHLLNMTSGLACDEAPGSNGPNHEFGVDEGDNPLQYSLNIPMLFEPGEKWRYCSANSFLLAATVSAALKTAKRESIFDFADQFLMEPLGITNYRLTRSADGKFLNGQGNSHFLPADLAKFGQLLLNKGLWQKNNHQQVRIISLKSVESIYNPRRKINWSFTDGLSIERNHPTQYSNQWYHTRFDINTKSINTIHSWGNGGQYIFVIPSLDSVVVFTGSNQGNFLMQKQPFDIMQRYVLPELLQLQDLTEPN